MPRLPEELIAQIKQNIDLVQLIQSQGNKGDGGIKF